MNSKPLHVDEPMDSLQLIASDLADIGRHWTASRRIESPSSHVIEISIDGDEDADVS